MAAPAPTLAPGTAPSVVAGEVRRGSDSLRRFTGAIARNRKAGFGLGLLILISVVAAVPQLFTGRDPQALLGGAQQLPSATYWLGTTNTGQDVYSQLIWGTRLTLIITVVAGGLASFVSVVIGVAAAYLGGWPDRLLSLLTDVFLIIPTLPLLIIMAAYLSGAGTDAIILALVVTGWAFSARQLRAQALSLRTRDFLEAARVRGERPFYIIMVEILPTNFMGLSTYMVATAAGLQYLGLGNTSEVTWGTMLHYAEENGAIFPGGNPFWVLAPGFAVVLMGAAFAFLNYAFDEIGNPALRSFRRRRAKPAA
jgi:peptide/nickel transport system permease protein